MTKKADEKKAKAIEYLKEIVKPGDDIYTILKHVSRSGMYRVIDVYKMVDNQPYRLSWNVALATGSRYDTNHEGVGISGCGMDMGFAIVYDLSYVLFHNNADGKDPGYSLKQHWMG